MGKKSDKRENGAGKERTLVTLLLDRSGSMQGLKSDTIGAINAYRAELRASDADIRYTQIHFDTGPERQLDLETVLLARKIAKVPDMTEADYHPRGATPLIDAACTTIRAVAESLAEKGAEDRTRVVIAIQTDGHENASVENRWEDLKALIAEKERAGWQFLFMGTGIDAYDQGARMGIARKKTISYGGGGEHTEAAFVETAILVRSMAEDTVLDLAFSDDQKRRAGDTS